MKKAFRIVLPIVLAVVILLCLTWYLFIYDQEFTRDMLLTGARHFEASGNHQAASWFYDFAYRQADDNDAVAIELAQQHKAAGNYTQAEYTLSNAIADGGGVELYIALCNTYVEQDKLLDAVTMLDTVSNPVVKLELDLLRPNAPTTSTEPGFYSQYLSVDISTESGTLYATGDGEYPSIEDAAYSQPIMLHEGENIIYALSVGENGLVSPLSIFGYTVGGVIEKLEFSDPTVETAVRAALGVSEEKELFTNDLWDITSFTVPCDASSLEDLRHFAFLEELIICSGIPGHLTNISGLANLQRLTVTDTPVSQEELQVIGSLPALQELTLSGCSLSTIKGLENAKQLKLLDLSNNTLRNIDPIKSIPGLKTLYIHHNALNDLSALSSCTELTKLDISYNSVSTLDPLSSISHLNWLNASHNLIGQIGLLGKLTELTNLSLAYNNLTDIAALSACVNLTELNLSNNSLVDLSILADLVHLAQLDFSHNQVTEIPAWLAEAALVQIDGSHNLITSLSPLSGLENLNNVFMDYNPELESVDELAECHVLIQVNVYGTKVTDAQVLKDMSVIVNFDPTQE